MKAKKFKHHNIVFAEDQPEYMPLPALKFDDPQGNVVTCWKLSFRDKLRIMFGGKVWLNMMTFNKALTPVYLSTNRKEMFSLPRDKKNLLKRIFTFPSNKQNK